MTPSAAEISERMPAWSALSEFFLDTQLQPTDYERIAAKLAATRYSISEMDDILNFEVYPACSGNLFSIAGEWTEFDPAWIKAHLTPRFGNRPLLNLNFLHNWSFAHQWHDVRTRITAIRTSAPSA